MKKIVLSFIILLSGVNMYAQCGTCTTLTPLRDYDFSQWTGGSEFYSFSCTSENPGDDHITVLAWSFNHFDLPNWLNVNGTPTVISGSPVSVNLETYTPEGVDEQCASFGSQGIAANYPFLARGQYQVTLNFAGGTNLCQVPNNSEIDVIATSGLTDHTPGYYLEPPGSWGAGVIPTFFRTYQPAPSPPDLSGTPLPPSWSFCQLTPMLMNLSQLYIYVNQHSAENYTDPLDSDEWAVAGLNAQVSSVDVKLCNSCPTQLYVVNSTSSTEPSTHALFSDGGLFVDAGIDIAGPYIAASPFTNNPNLNTLLWAKYIAIDRIASPGQAFLAQVNYGSFFEMLPNPACDKVPDINCGPITCSFGDCSGCIRVPFSSFTLTAGLPGGTWSADHPEIGAINPTTGMVTESPGSAGGCIPLCIGSETFTYTLGDCSVSTTIKFSDNCGEKRPDPSNANTDSLLRATPTDISIFPNPAQNIITVSYSCKPGGQSNISIRDISGRIVYVDNVVSEQGGVIQKVIDMSALTAGIYLVDVTLNEQHVIKKVVKL